MRVKLVLLLKHLQKEAKRNAAALMIQKFSWVNDFSGIANLAFEKQSDSNGNCSPLDSQGEQTKTVLKYLEPEKNTKHPSIPMIIWTQKVPLESGRTNRPPPIGQAPGTRSHVIGGACFRESPPGMARPWLGWRRDEQDWRNLNKITYS